MVEVEESGSGANFVVDSKVLETVGGSVQMKEHSQGSVEPVVPRYSQVSEAVSELEAMHSFAVGESSKGTVASLTVVLAGVEQVEPREVDVGQGFDLGPRDSLEAVRVLGAAGPMMVGAQAAQVLVPMDSN